MLCDIRSVQTEEKREKVKRENVKRNNSSWNFQKQPVWTTSVLQQKCPYCQLWKLVHWLEIHSNSQYELKFNFTLSTINLFSGVKLDLGGEVWLKNKKNHCIELSTPSALLWYPVLEPFDKISLILILYKWSIHIMIHFLALRYISSWIIWSSKYWATVHC